MPDPMIPRVSVATLRARLDDTGLHCWLIHATDRLAFHEGHIPGALARPDDAVLRRLADGSALVVYGEDEHAEAAPALVTVLHRLDVEVAWFAGGLAAWRSAGLPIERSG